MARNYAALLHEYLEEMEDLSDAEFGRLCRSLLEYSMTGTSPALSGNERFYFKRVKMQEDRFQASYDDLTEKRRDAGIKGAQAKLSKAKQSQAKLSKAKQSQATLSKTSYTKTETKTKTETNTSPAIAGRSNADGGSFEAFWTAYPKKKSKGDARRAWEKLKPSDDLVTAIMEKLSALKKSTDWTKESGKYIPYPATWLNKEGWNDEVKPSFEGPQVSNPEQVRKNSEWMKRMLEEDEDE